jgi:hypothetical protein
MKFFYCITLVLAFASSLVTMGQQRADDTVRHALRYEQTHDNGPDIVFNRRNLEIRRKWMTLSLYRLYLIELAREERESKERPDEKPYLGDGMDFSPMKESCKVGNKFYLQRFLLSKARVLRTRAYVRARFFYHPDCDYGEYTYYTFILKRGGRAWFIDDIDYGKKRTLRGDLRRSDN